MGTRGDRRGHYLRLYQDVKRAWEVVCVHLKDREQRENAVPIRSGPEGLASYCLLTADC